MKTTIMKSRNNVGFTALALAGLLALLATRAAIPALRAADLDIIPNPPALAETDTRAEPTPAPEYQVMRGRAAPPWSPLERMSSCRQTKPLRLWL